MMLRLNHLAQLCGSKLPGRFVISGITATAAHWLSMTLLVETGFSASVATVIGSIIGALSNYLLQKTYTFSNSTSHRQSLLKYLASCVIAWLLNLLIFLLIQATTHLGIAMTQVVTSFLVAFFNYQIYKRFVFHVEPQPKV
jgi:putative flippase GtrA